MESQKDSHRIRVLLDEETIARRVLELARQIDADFEVQSRMVDRKALPKVKGDKLKLNWSDFASDRLASPMVQCSQ